MVSTASTRMLKINCWVTATLSGGRPPLASCAASSLALAMKPTRNSGENNFSSAAQLVMITNQAKGRAVTHT